MLLKKIAWFLAIFLALIAVTSITLAYLEPGRTDPGELGRMAGRKIVLIVIATSMLYYAAKRRGWIIKRTVADQDPGT